MKEPEFKPIVYNHISESAYNELYPSDRVKYKRVYMGAIPRFPESPVSSPCVGRIISKHEYNYGTSDRFLLKDVMVEYKLIL